MGRYIQGPEPDIPGLLRKSPTNQVLTRHFKDVGLLAWSRPLDPGAVFLPDARGMIEGLADLWLQLSISGGGFIGPHILVR